ncbi:MAG TPA: RNA-directed DNA polymerase [Nitrospira sp.]|nr:RNA-directed DNA polymerase [Nitrospira sp.]
MFLQQLVKITGLSEAYIIKLARTASHRYRTYQIPKRKSGVRTIDHPSRHLKFLQRWLVRNIFSYAPVHPSVYSYKEGVSIRQHASLHVKSKYTLRIDFRDFFPSIKSADVQKLLDKNVERFPFQLTDRDIHIILSLSSKDGKLTIGAPCSPAVSNAIMYDFDKHWSQRSKRLNVIYSRYADDIYFSTNRSGVLSKILSELKEHLATRDSPRLILNNAKTVFASRKRRRVVTGIVITPTRKLSLGREKKRQLRTLTFLFGKGQLDRDRAKSLQGFLSYASTIEPIFISRLRKKFGDELISKIVQMP